MAYIPEDLSILNWASPINIVGSDAVANLDEAVNSIITTDPASLVTHINTEMAKITPYISTELSKIYVEVDSRVVAAEAAKVAAEASATAAAASQTASALSETNAGNSETAAAGSASTASTAATSATSSAGTASTAATSATASETSATASETAAAASETAAAGSETAAAGSAAAANTDAGTASAAATSATASATSATTSETNAGSSATSAAGSASSAASSATSATASKNAAATSETNAALSESNASGYATSAGQDAASSGQSATAAAASELSAANSAAAASAAPAINTFKNKLINGNFNVWQRGTFFTFPDSTFTADRWIAGCWDSGFVTSQPLIVSTNSYKSGFIQLNAETISDASNTYFTQKVELDSALIQEIDKVGSLTFSTKIKAVNSNLNYIYNLRFYKFDGTYELLNEDNVTIVSDNNYHTIVFTTTNITLIDNTTGSEPQFLSVGMSASDLSNNRIYQTNAQLELGEIATPFEQRPIGLELSLCQRYYQLAAGSHRRSRAINGDTLSSQISFATAMVSYPTVEFISVQAESASVSTTILYTNTIGARFNSAVSADGDAYSLQSTWAFDAEL